MYVYVSIHVYLSVSLCVYVCLVCVFCVFCMCVCVQLYILGEVCFVRLWACAISYECECVFHVCMEKFQQLVSHRIDCSTAIQHDERSVIAYLQRAGNFSNK